MLSEMVIYLHMNKDSPWVLEPWHVRVAFRKASVMVPEEAITLPPHTIAGPDPALQGKEFAVMVKVRKCCEFSLQAGRQLSGKMQKKRNKKG